MAMFEKEIKDGIQPGKALDYCWKCYGPGSTIKHGELEYKDVFKIHINGLEYCLCMNHFFQLLDNSDYAIVNKDSLTDDDIITIPKSLAKDGTEEEVKQYIEKAIKLKNGDK